jgi:gas vesicle protein
MLPNRNQRHQRKYEGTMSDINQGGGMGILVAAMVGAAVGAGVALLLAPCSGKETRDWLAQRTGELKDRTTNAFEQGKESIRRAAKDIGRDADAVATTLRG